MNTSEEIKKVVKEKYGEIAKQSLNIKQSSCCGPKTPCCGDTSEFTILSDEYTTLKGYNPDADLNLGCGLPTEFAKIKEGDTVVDLGSGAGNDVFIARAETGEKGKVIGIDFTEEMIEKARKNNEKLGYKNVEFIYGDIDNLPIEDNSTDVVVSNCVLNLVPDKTKAFNEIYRILKPGGHFSVSDLVTTAELPEKLRKVASLYAGCISGALIKEEYIDVIKKTRFKNIVIQKETAVEVPESMLLNYMSKEELNDLKANHVGIMSITVYAEK
jgi:arsenite methyltransferase